MLTMWVYPRDVWNDRSVYVGVWHLGTNRLRLSTRCLSCRKMGKLSHAWRDLEWGLSPNLSCVSVRGGLSGHSKCSPLPWMALQWWVHVSNGTVAQRLKCLPAMQETWVRSLGQEDPLEKKMATHSSTLAWRIPWTEEPGGLQSTGLQRVGHDWATSLSLSVARWTI